MGSYFILFYWVSFKMVRMGLWAWPGAWASFAAGSGLLEPGGSVGNPSLCHAAVTPAHQRRGGEQALQQPSCLLPKFWTKICRKASTRVPSSQPHLKRSANGLWLGSLFSSQGWNQTVLQGVEVSTVLWSPHQRLTALVLSALEQS